MAEEKISLLLMLKDKISKAVSKIKASFSKNMKAMQTSALVFAGAFAGVVAGVYKAVTAFKEQERVEAELEQRLKSTGYAAGVTADEVKQLAVELQKTTGVSDEVTLSATNMLLTFTNIGKESLPLATEAVLDMTAAMNKGKITQEGLKASAIMLGKGLNDPIGQLGALSRVGIAFTDQQKAQIKAMARAGDMAGSQAIILAELKKEFGGTASNLQTLEGAQRASAAAFGDMLEVIGEAFLPVARSLAIFIKNASDAFKNFLPKIKDLIVPITVFVGGLTGLLAIGGAIVTLGPMLAAAFAAITGPIGLAVIAVTGIISAFLYFKNSNSTLAVSVRAAWNTMGIIIKEYAGAVLDELKNLGQAYLNFGKIIKSVVTGRFGEAKKAFGDMQASIKNTGQAFIEASKKVSVAFQDNVQAEKNAIAEGIAAKEAEKEKRAEIEAAAIEARLEAKAGEQESTLELDQEFIDRKAEMDAIAEEARQEFETQKTEFEQLTADQRTKILIDKLGKERILKDTNRINELIKQGKHEKAMELQTKMYQDAFIAMNKKTLDKLDTGWKLHWAYLLAGEKMNKKEREKVDQALYNVFHNIMSLFNKDSMAAFNILKGVAIAETIVNTIAAAQAAFRAMAGIPPAPVWGVVAATAASVAGMARVDQIRRQEPPKAETGGYVKKGGYAEIHEGEDIITKKQREGLAGIGTQEINLVVDGEVLARVVVDAQERMQEEGTI